MSLTKGQQNALDQLERIANVANSALRIDFIENPTAEDGFLEVDITIDCRLYEKADGGLALNDKESFQIVIHSNFPYSQPSLWVSHTRFSGFPHVQWLRYICLYQAPEVEWVPQGGMFDYINRVGQWLKMAALNQLDADGQPIHPPAVYTSAETIICIDKDAPKFTGKHWIGGAHLDRYSQNRLNLTNWMAIENLLEVKNIEPVILLSKPLSFEFPRTILELVTVLNEFDISIDTLIFILSISARKKEDNEHMHLVIGSPMRGTSGDINDRKQHLAVWEIDSIDVKGLALIAKSISLLDRTDDKDIQKEVRSLTSDVIRSVKNWMKKAKVK